MNSTLADFIVALIGLITSLVALAMTLRYFQRTWHRGVGTAWLFILLAVFAIALSESTDVVNLFVVKIPSRTSEVFGIFAEIALAVGFVRLYGFELAEEHARQDSLRQRLRQVESLSSAALELSANLQLSAVLRDLVQRTLELTGADVVGVYRVGDDSAPSEVELVFVRRGEGPPKIRKHSPSELTRLVVSTAQPQIIENISGHLLGKLMVGLESAAFYPMLREQKVTAVLFTGFRKKHRFSENDRHLLFTLAEHAALAIYNAELYETVEQLSVTDPLTGLANRRRFNQGLSAELARARRYKKPLSLIMIDLDNFKAINDQYGHPVGDLVLVTVAGALYQSCREADIAARVGGEEFGLILPETEAEEAVRVAERVRRQLASTPIVWEGQTLIVTLSAGVIGNIGESLPPDAAALFRLADRALYRAKQRGRNQVVLGQTKRMEPGGER